MSPGWIGAPSLLDPRNGAACDLPPPQVPVRTWLIASLPRTGSTLLCRLVEQTGQAGVPKEYLNPMQVRDWEARLAPDALTRLRHRLLRGPLVPLAGRGPWTEARLEAYLRRVQARRSSPDGWFGLKIHHHHFQRWFLDTGWSVDRLLRPAAWVMLTREDHVAQAVSWYRALQTGRWVAEQAQQLPPVYDRRAIAARLRAIEHAEAAWERWFTAQRLAPLRLRYEALTADPDAAVRAVLAHLGLPPPAPLPPSPPMIRQADDLSQAWIARFRAGR